MNISEKLNEVLEGLKDDLQSDIETRTRAIEAGVTVDLAVRLALFCAAQVMDSKQIDTVFRSCEEFFPPQYESEERQIVMDTLKRLRKSISILSGEGR